MNGKQLKNSILQWAIQGKLVPQDPNDEPASVLLEKIRQEKKRLIKEKKIKRDKNASIIYRGEDNSYYEKILATGEVKCIDEEIPFEIPKGWEWCRMGELISYQNGYAYTSSELNKEGKGLPVIKSGNLMTYEVLLKPNNDYVENPSTKMLASAIQKGDLLMCLSSQSDNPEPLGKTAIYKANNTALLNQRVLKMRPWIEDMLEYMYYAINSEYFHYTVSHQGGGSAQANLKLGYVLSMLIPLAPLKEEIRIVDKINTIMPLVHQYETTFLKQKKLNSELNDRLKSAILQEAIQGKLVPQINEEGTALELLEQIKTEKLKLVKEGKLKKSALNNSVIFRGDDNKYYELIDNSPVCIDEFLPFQIPETWTWCKVKDLLEIQTGASFKKEQANANKKGIRILRGGNILPNKYIFKDDDVFVSEEFVNANTILKKNCIITPAVTSLENIGKMAVIEKDYNNVSAGGFVFIISPYIQDFNHSLLLAYFLQSPFLIEAMRGITKKSGAAFYNLGKERLKELYLPLPPMAEQSRIIGKINEILSSIMSK